MSDIDPGGKKAFSARVIALRPQVEYRSDLTARDREDIYRLRYSAYTREGTIAKDAPEIFDDVYDDLPNAKLVGIYIEGQLVASFRIHWVNANFRVYPAMKVFSDFYDPVIDAGMTIIDPSRFVLDAQYSRKYPLLAYLACRIPFMACEHYEADVNFACIRVEHRAFYTRFFEMRQVAPGRVYPSITKLNCLMAADFSFYRDICRERYPFLLSTEEERGRIFGPKLSMRPRIIHDRIPEYILNLRNHLPSEMLIEAAE